MANDIQTQVLEDGNRNTIIKVTIVGDGTGDETDTVIFDASAYKTASTDNSLRQIKYNLNGFDATLYWDGAANVVLMTLDQDLQEDVDFSEHGKYPALVNNAGAGRTGDILITTNGLGAGDEGYMVLYINQRNLDNPR